MRRPVRRLAEGIVTHIERRPVDYGVACTQWEEYKAALQAHGFELIEVPEAPDCPDSVFVEDPVVVYRNVAVLTRSGEESRRAEVAGLETVLDSLGYSVHRIVDPGTLEGGDVLKVGKTVYVGRGDRTNDEGIVQLAAIVEPLGATVVPVPITKVLHLKSAVTALPDGTVIGYPPAVDDPSVFPSFMPVPEESGAHVVILDERTVLMAADCPKSAQLFTEMGFEVVPVDISQFELLEGCVTCLSVRLRELP